MARLKTTAEIRTERLRTPRVLHDLVVAMPWPKTDSNLGSLARTTDALRGCIAVPDSKAANKAITRGNTIGVDNTCVHRIGADPVGWLRFVSATHVIVAVELAHGSIPLADLVGSLEPVVIVLGHESQGIPDEVLEMAHVVVEIPMSGVGNSLNVAVAGSLVAYKWAGLS